MVSVIPKSEGEQLQRIDFQERLVRHSNWSCCLNCCHWLPNYIGEERPPGCDLAAKSVPPPSVIVVGCQKWEMDIPF